MAGENPADALRHYLEPLQRAVQCVSKTAQLITNCHDPKDGKDHFVAFAGNEPIRVSNTRGDVHHRIMVRQLFRVVSEKDRDRGPWRVSTQQYDYAVSDDDGREIVLYHWHPGEQGFNPPHLHLPRDPVLGKAHMPTGRVSLEAFVNLLIREFKVHAHDVAYRKHLEQSEEKFLKFKNW